MMIFLLFVPLKDGRICSAALDGIIKIWGDASY